MSNNPVDPNVQRVVVTASTPPSDDVTVVINGQAYGGWQDVRISRGIERLPSDFDLRLTDIYAGEADALQIRPGDACVVKIGKSPVVTGYIDIVMPSIAPGVHEISISGRSKCADLVDCSAEWPGRQIPQASLLEIARKLAEPYGIQVDSLDGPGKTTPYFSLSYGETPFEIIERLCRYSELLAYDDTDGNLLLARTSEQRAASGFREGVNVLSASATYSMHDRFSEYQCFPNAFNTLLELGDAGFLMSSQVDQGVTRHRVKHMISDGTGLGGPDVAKARAGWEASRRFGRSFAVRLTTDSWRDRAGALYEPNTKVPIDLASLKVTSRIWTISEVTYRKSSQGTLCDLLILPPQAFDVQPTAFQGGGAIELGALPPNLGRP